MTCRASRSVATLGPRFNEAMRMTIHFELVPLLSLVAGIAILVVPKLLNYIVAGYLIAMGVIGLAGL